MNILIKALFSLWFDPTKIKPVSTVLAADALSIRPLTGLLLMEALVSNLIRHRISTFQPELSRSMVLAGFVSFPIICTRHLEIKSDDVKFTIAELNNFLRCHALAVVTCLHLCALLGREEFSTETFALKASALITLPGLH